MKITPKVIDISHYDNVHPGGFAKLRDAGYLGVINKASQGRGMTDKTFASRRSGARSASLVISLFIRLSALGELL